MSSGDVTRDISTSCVTSYIHMSSTCPSPMSLSGAKRPRPATPDAVPVAALKKAGFALLEDVNAVYDTAFILSDVADLGIEKAEQRSNERIDNVKTDAACKTPRTDVLIQRIGMLEVTCGCRDDG